ncbi:serine/threonine protein kinase [Uliginosibacterium gangwonense]|uniref:serine/threonine protein kinase n=1 Tax=Uliginosibacterium gangwonense TaxID=392736 RepID=UPI0003A3882F|nr:serine/threonine-protein kinase [Uliginosibacterium gangwonense]
MTNSATQADIAPLHAHTTPHTPNALPIGARMGEFEIVGLIGEGGFGIVYLAYDHSLHRQVALKEYIPVSLAGRNPDGSVSVRTPEYEEAFAAGRSSFVNEARLLAQFDHPALVKVFRFWQANGTAYMVMPYYVGKTLRQVMQERPTLDETWIKRFLSPVLDALEVIHRENCFHRDISPDNIIVLPNDRPVLLDFGAARRVISGLTQTQSLTVFVKHSYAPVEQYGEVPNLNQGAWTDIYTLGVMLYFMITRKLPPPSVSRVVEDRYEPLVTVAAGRYSEAFLSGVDLCLRVRPEQRPQNISEMRLLLGIRSKRSKSSRHSSRESHDTDSQATKTSSGKHDSPLSRLASQRMPLGAALGVVLVLVGVAYYVGMHVSESDEAALQPGVAASQAVVTTSSHPVVAESAPVVVAPATTSTPAAKPVSKPSTKSSGSHASKRESNDGVAGAAKHITKGAKTMVNGVTNWAKRTFGK